ncbi:MAG TPA: SGNH/GDSL hydrolase family protein, partial [Solirubrobacterales bacterium]
MKRISCAIVVLCALVVPASPATAAAPVPYVALGDSYSSGEGNGPFDGPCHRALAGASAYPRMLPSLVGYLAQPSFHACTGATIADVLARPQPRRGNQRIQLEYVDPSTRLVTLTIGGNDLGFEDIVKQCLLPGNCSKWKLAERVEAGLQTIKPHLVDAYTQVRSHMDSGGQLLVAGYPRLFVSEDADCKLFISDTEAKWMNSLVIRGNRRIAEAARAARRQRGNVSYVDVTERFAGHELCSDDPWLYGIHITAGDGIYKGSYHPRPSGQAAYASAFATLL